MATLKENISVLPLHAESLCKFLNVMRQEGKFCDIRLMCKGRQYTVHKNILAANSDRFINLFTNGTRVLEAVDAIELNIEPKIMDILLDFMYVGKAHMVQDLVEDVMQAAHELKLISIFSHCRNNLLDNLNPHNYCRVWSLGDTYNDELLKKKATSYAAKNFHKIAQENNFLELSLSQLKSLLIQEEVTQHSQDRVLESIIDWVKHNKDERKTFLSALITFVKFEHLTKSYLQILVDQEEIVWECPELMRYITKTVFARYLQGDSDHGNSPTEGSSSSLGTVEEVESEVAMAVFAENEEKRVICQCYSIEQNEWYPPEELPLQMTNMAVIVHNQTVFLIGGKQGNKYLKTIYHYKVTDGELLEGQNMQVARSHTAVAECNNRIYVIGGYNSSGFLASVECYNPAENEWRQVAPLSEGKGGMGVASVSRFLYVVGGRTANSVSPLMTVECYDIYKDQWTKIIPLPHARSHCGVAVLQHKIYVIGGYTKNGSSGGNMLCYNPLTKFWSEIVPPPTEDWVTDAVTYENFLYVLTDSGQIFKFDPIKKLWNVCSTGPPDSAYYVAAVLVNRPVWDA